MFGQDAYHQCIREEPESVLAPRQLSVNESEGRVQTFVGLPMKNDEECVVDPPPGVQKVHLREKEMRSRRELMVLQKDRKGEKCSSSVDRVVIGEIEDLIRTVLLRFCDFLWALRCLLSKRDDVQETTLSECPANAAKCELWHRLVETRFLLLNCPQETDLTFVEERSRSCDSSDLK
ncbi:hypothetical protein TNCV_4562061 [Trichonephila clavipes]|nr:hypothetical protein TNCV_4562061 [Trichonephila clavipes]